jgi:hypothetical protein
MPSYTPYLGLAYFDFGDELDSTISAQLEADRFITIDKQIYGLFSIFGNGTISGWEVYDNGYSRANGISIGISDGIGIVKYLAIETTVASFVNSLPPNSTVYIYVLPIISSSLNRGVSFIASLVEISSFALKLAKVVTSARSITSIDNTVRDYIEAQGNMMDAVLNHKHRGIPSKIDLEHETKGLLPGAKIEGFDVSKSETGKLSIERIPSLDHTQLAGIGNLSHPAIDTIVQLLDETNLGLMGEIASVNLMKLIIFMKYRYDTTDRYMINELAIIPGVSPSSDIDEDASSAMVDIDSGCIIGYPVGTGTTYFFTSNFDLPDNMKKLILTSNKSMPTDSSIAFGINTTNSVDFDDYEIVTENSLHEVSGTGLNLRVGIKFVWGGGLPNYNEDEMDFLDYIYFFFENESGDSASYHFRIRVYSLYDKATDTASGLIYTFSTREDADRWFVTDAGHTFTDSMPCSGYTVGSGEEIVVNYYPDLSTLLYNKVYYIIVDVWDGTEYTSTSDVSTFKVSGGSNVDPCSFYDYLPIVKNFAVMFELDNEHQITLNI